MRKAETLLAIIRKRGERGLQVKNAYRLLYQKDLYIMAYGKLYSNPGAMTQGITSETVDGMSLEKIDAIINALRYKKYRWTPVKRVYIPKRHKNGNNKLRPLGLPVWSDKLLQEVIRSIFEAYYEPQFSNHSHGFRPNRGCHTALREVMQKGKGTKWFIEGDICACFDKIDHSILLDIIREKFPDNRFLRLINMLLKAGYLEDWKFNKTFSGVPQGSNLGPICSNLVLDRLDKYIEQELIPAYKRGKRRKTNPPYVRLTMQAFEARKRGDWELADKLHKQAQSMPSRDPHDPDFRRLWYVRYADDSLLGLTGSKNEALEIKHKIAEFLNSRLKLELSVDKTLITHAGSQKAKFLGYEVHVLHDNSKHDRRGQRCINSSIGLRVPAMVKHEKCKRYMKGGKPFKILQRTIDDSYSIVSQYQAEYRGMVQYYRMAYNLHTLNKLRHVMEVSMVKTLASKYKTTCTKIYRKYSTTIKTDEGDRKVIMVKRDRKDNNPLTAHFGGVSLKWNKWVNINERHTEPIWNNRSDLIQRLEAQECELCDSNNKIEVHHIRKLSSLARKGAVKSQWKKRMMARNRKTLVVCQKCHVNIHNGRYDGRKLTA